MFNLFAGLICTIGVIIHSLQLSSPRFKSAHHINRWAIVICGLLAIANFILAFV